MDYNYKVVYRHEGEIRERLYNNTRDITTEFNINRDLVKNIYMKVPKTIHPVVISIDRLPVPLKRDAQIVIDFS
jgi:hypothetical protein